MAIVTDRSRTAVREPRSRRARATVRSAPLAQDVPGVTLPALDVQLLKCYEGGKCLKTQQCRHFRGVAHCATLDFNQDVLC